MKLARNILLLLLMIVLVACTGSPSQSDLETQLKPKLTKSAFDVISIKKLSGKTDDSGKQIGINAKVYEIEYEYEIKFKRSLVDLRAEIEKENEAERKKSREATAKAKNMDEILNAASASFNSAMNSAFSSKVTQLDELEMAHGNFKAGEVKKIKNSCLFEKTDKGWTLINI